jgi:hypothetical protein
LAAPAVLAQIAAAELLADVIDATRELSGQALEMTAPKLRGEKAA